MYFSTALIASILAASQLVAGHGAIIKAVGDAGGQGAAIGTDPATPRDGTKRNPFQQDTTRFRGANKAACGQTLAGGDNTDIAAGVKAVMANNGNTMPQVTQGGMIMMTLHQVNGDGAGPYTCGMDSTGTAANFANVNVAQNVPGKNSRSKAKATDFPLNVQVPADMTCTGTMAGANNVCLVRCMNAARAGPFGGCVAVQMTGAGAAAAGNTTTTPAAAAAPPAQNSAAAAADSAAADTQEED